MKELLLNPLVLGAFQAMFIQLLKALPMVPTDTAKKIHGAAVILSVLVAVAVSYASGTLTTLDWAGLAKELVVNGLGAYLAGVGYYEAAKTALLKVTEGK